MVFTLRYGLTTLHFGVGALGNAKEFLSRHGKVVVVTGRSSARVSGALGDVERALKECGASHVVYDKVSPNPTASQVEELARLAWSEGVDLVVAIGGGSVIDVAKLASVLALSGGSVVDYVRGVRKPKRSIPLIAVNLTHGTGTEVDRFAVVTLEEAREKHGLAVKYPEVSVDDPRYTLTMDRNQTVYTSLDALYHAYESATGKSRNPFVETLAKEATFIIASNLPAITGDPRNLDLRERLLYASMIAGIALDMGLTHVIHAIEHALSGLQPRLAHGCGLAMLAPRSVFYVHKAVPGYSATILRSIDPAIKPLAEDSERAQRALEGFQMEIGFEEKLGDYGFTEKDVDTVVEYVMRKLSYMYRNSPFPLSEEVIREIVRYAF